MSENLSRAPDAPDTPTGSPDWPAQVTDGFVRLVDRVKDKTTRPVATLARGVVYGLVVASLGIVMAVLGVVGLFRALDRLRNLVVADSVWLTYLVLGAVFFVIGAIIFSKRTPRA